MATAQQIADVRFKITDTDSNHYAFSDTEIGETYDEEGTVLRAAHTLWGIIAGSGEKLSSIFQIDVTDAYSFDVSTRACERRLEQLETNIIAGEEGEYVYEEDDDDRWTWSWKSKISDMIA